MSAPRRSHCHAVASAIALRDGLRVIVLMAAVVTIVPAAPAAWSPAEPILIDGLSLEEWRDRMGVLELRDPASRAAVPGLIELARRDDVPWFTRRQAALTLGRLGPLAPEGVDVLQGLVEQSSDDPATMLWAVKGMELYGSLAGPGTPQLIAAFRHPESETLVRLSVISALSQIGAAHPQAIPFLLSVVEHRELELRESSVAAERHGLSIRLAAVEALGVIGPPAAIATPALIRVLDDPDESLRREAAVALGRMGATAAAAAEPLALVVVRDERPAVRDAAAHALGQIGPAGAGEMIELLLRSEDAEACRLGVNIVSSWGSSSAPWWPLVETLESDEREEVRLAALLCRWDAGFQTDDRARALIRMLGAMDRHVSRQALKELIRRTEILRRAEPELESLRDDDRSAVRRSAERALRELHASRRDE